MSRSMYITLMRWTNESVLKFAGDSDPIEAIEFAARNLVMQAKDAGWAGPPYNPAKLADILGVTIRANAGIPDARVLPTEHGIVIEYNPTHSRERVRFSLAHEIAHLLFPDHAKMIRNRAKIKDGDEWQLEMLCNIAASEFIMPFGSFPTSGENTTITSLMECRRELDVSAEAFLIRFVKETDRPISLVVLTPDNNQKYRVDYVVREGFLKSPRDNDLVISDTSNVKKCIAIGMTATFEENWFQRKQELIECVAIPNSRGNLFPRIAALVHHDLSEAQNSGPIYSHGDVRYLYGEGAQIFCQLVNNSARRWGGGVAKQTAKRFPAAEAQFGEWINAIPKERRLGSVSFIEARNRLFIASLVAQEGYGPSSDRRLSYAALNEGLNRVRELAQQYDATIHMPKIGTGAAGGNWEIIEDIIKEQLVRFGIKVTVYIPAPIKEPELDLFA